MSKSKKILISLFLLVFIIIVTFVLFRRDEITINTIYVQKEKSIDKIDGTDIPFLHEPTSIEISNDTLYFIDQKNYRIVITDMNLNYINSFGRKGKGPGEFESPNWIKVTSDKIFVSDIRDQRIKILHKNGKYIGSFSCMIIPGSNFAVTNNNSILLSNPYGDSIVVEYAFQGNVISKFGLPLNVDKNLPRIKNTALITTDEQSNIYLSFYEYPIIRKYDSKKNLLWEYNYEFIEEVKTRRKQIEERETKNPEERKGVHSLVIYNYIHKQKLYHNISCADYTTVIFGFDCKSGTPEFRIKAKDKKFLPFAFSRSRNNFYFTDGSNVVKASLVK
jgi:hypothetical protein